MLAAGPDCHFDPRWHASDDTGIFNSRRLAFVCDAKSSFPWKDARDPRFDSERNGQGAPFTFASGRPTEFLVGIPRKVQQSFDHNVFSRSASNANRRGTQL
jgi:hypothetical protein